MKTQIAFLLPKSRFPWESMNTVFGKIQESWKVLALDQDKDVHFLFATEAEGRKFDVIVFPAFNHEFAQFFIKQRSLNDFRGIFYTYSTFSRVGYDYHVTRAEALFLESDLFVTSSQAFAQLGRYTYQRMNTCVLPYHYTPVERPSGSRPLKFLYLGRIAAEKNLEFLVSIQETLRKKFQMGLELYGKVESNAILDGLTTQGASYKGVLSQEEVQDLLARNNVVLFQPSKSVNDCYGLSSVEVIMNSGIVFCHDYGCFKDHLKTFPKNVFDINHFESRFNRQEDFSFVTPEKINFRERNLKELRSFLISQKPQIPLQRNPSTIPVLKKLLANPADFQSIIQNDVALMAIFENGN